MADLESRGARRLRSQTGSMVGPGGTSLHTGFGNEKVAAIAVEGHTDAEREGSVVWNVAKGKAGDDGDPQRKQPILENVLEGMSIFPVGPSFGVFARSV